MPLNEPAPLAGTAAQPEPNGVPIALLIVEEPVADEVGDAEEVVELVGAALEDEGAAPEVVLGVAVEPHAARPIGSAARRATKAVVRRAFMSESCFPRKGWW